MVRARVVNFEMMAEAIHLGVGRQVVEYMRGCRHSPRVRQVEVGKQQ
jgi:hypothetical protein